ncbi:CPBP family intramembrane glutamic endopeptidase [Polyangium jinanense]|uniref:CPBP family intramembrane metalloprotease n=1 Tax=Polyangium jinanense TaxID=2829994 RepID=A0A9X3X526_9BACT|nr:CPBP family intramembrane glutamic endopeptidase [Polyangium jinanense]MDC3958084.1 CPBP family intramembrane metalloprotease [Polyangium jinanense]MDC3983717.1 CPBP family intramembrane metalloprotease [Polyangium jinanense]
MATGQHSRRKFGVLFGMGVVGVLSLLPVYIPQLRQLATTGGAHGWSLPALVVASVFQFLFLMALGVALGMAFAPRLHLRSHIAAWAAREPKLSPGFWKEAPLALGLGALTALVLLVLDHFFAPSMGEATAQKLYILQDLPLNQKVMNVLHGGINEELIYRWGLASFLAWLIGSVRGKASGSPPAGTMWAAIVLAALVFGAAHLPVFVGQSIVALTTPVVVRTVVLNAIAGIVFGWLYFRRSLEAAMLAHAMLHITWAILSYLV